MKRAVGVLARSASRQLRGQLPYKDLRWAAGTSDLHTGRPLLVTSDKASTSGSSGKDEQQPQTFHLLLTGSFKSTTSPSAFIAVPYQPPSIGLPLSSHANSLCQRQLQERFILPTVGLASWLEYRPALRGYATSARGSEDEKVISTGGSSSATGVDGQGTETFVDRAKELADVALKEAQKAWETVPANAKEYLDWHHPVFQTIASEALVLGAFVFAWSRLPRYLRNVHRLQEEAKARFPDLKDPKSVEHHLQQQPLLFKGPVPYELSVYHALESPARLLASIFILTHLGALVAPASLGLPYLATAWKGGLLVSFVWSLYRWRGNFFARLLASKDLNQSDRDRYLAADKLSAIALLGLGTMGIAETCGVAVQSILTVGGIGGVATAFAARDVIGNFLSGLTLYLYRPFSVGDSITAGSVEGTVTDIGLHSTHLLSADKSPIIVPNSFFSSQVITNRSRAQWRSLTAKVPLPLSHVNKVPDLTQRVRVMLDDHPNVYMDQEKPHAYLSALTLTSAEVTVTCNIKPMTKHGYLLASEDILHRVSKILNEVAEKADATSASKPGS